MANTSTGERFASQSCPTNFTYLYQFHWDATECRVGGVDADSVCCMMVFGLFSMAIARYLKDTSLFLFPNLAIVSACIREFQTHMSSMLPSNLIQPCLDRLSGSVSSPSYCAGIQSLSDWKSLLGQTTIDTACKGDLLDRTACSLCKDATYAVTNRLVSFANHTVNATDTRRCYYFTCLYAVGVANNLGSTNINTVNCYFGPQLALQEGREVVDKLLYVYLGIGAGVLAIVCLGFLVLVSLMKIVIQTHRRRPNTGAIWLNYDTIKDVTRNFSERNLIGQGAFGKVYKGLLPDGSEIAVKRLKDASADAEFQNEMEVINGIRHRNLVALRGCCVTDGHKDGPQRILVYDYYPNGNIHDHLFGGKSVLTWSQRKNVILGTAHGLAYLHRGVRPAVFHRDVKPTNILLDAHMNALVADFGLAKAVNVDRLSSQASKVAGTFGYLAPEYALYGQLTENNDVYSFGILVLVILSGRPALTKSEDGQYGDYLVISEWAWRLLKCGKGIEVIDAKIREEVNEEAAIRYLMVGIVCAHVMVALRPTMNEAIRMFEGHLNIPLLPHNSTPYSLYSTSSSSSSL